jgi:hypothetical protein
MSYYVIYAYKIDTSRIDLDKIKKYIEITYPNHLNCDVFDMFGYPEENKDIDVGFFESFDDIEIHFDIAPKYRKFDGHSDLTIDEIDVYLTICDLNNMNFKDAMNTAYEKYYSKKQHFKNILKVFNQDIKLKPKIYAC